ncbi:hypothetical protein [Streptomyces sp. NPDC006012]|uniref:hypothetical protein n=1 Tax=Streptomyces sp. NPDC006012 TaxID=3364739 RepID=UPI0036CF1AE0
MKSKTEQEARRERQARFEGLAHVVFARRGARLVLAAAAGALAVGGIITAGNMGSDGDARSSQAAGSLTLTAQGGAAGAKCMAPDPDSLRGYPTLFEGTVTSVKGGSAVFHVDRWLSGHGATTVRLDTGSETTESLTFLAGEHYLVAAKDGVVPPCGANVASEDIRNLFRRAYGK